MILSPENMSIKPRKQDYKNNSIAYERVFSNAIGMQGHIIWVRFTVQNPPYPDNPHLYEGFSAPDEPLTDFNVALVKEDLKKLGILPIIR